MAEPGEALACILVAEPGVALACIRAAEHGEARGYTRPAGQRAGPACIRLVRQEVRVASRPSIWRGREQAPGHPPPACPRMRQARVRERCEPERPNGIARARAAGGRGRVRHVEADRGARRLDRLRDSLSHCPRYAATNRPCTHPYMRGTQLHAPRGFASCPKIWAKPRKFDGNVGAKVMIVRRWIARCPGARRDPPCRHRWRAAAALAARALGDGPPRRRVAVRAGPPDTAYSPAPCCPLPFALATILPTQATRAIVRPPPDYGDVWSRLCIRTLRLRRF